MDVDGDADADVDDGLWHIFFERRLATLNQRQADSYALVPQLWAQTVVRQRRYFLTHRRTLALLANVDEIQQRIRASQRGPVGVASGRRSYIVATRARAPEDENHALIASRKGR